MQHEEQINIPLYSMKEPSLRELKMIMREVAEEAREKSKAAEEDFFRKIAEQIKKECC